MLSLTPSGRGSSVGVAVVVGVVLDGSVPTVVVAPGKSSLHVSLVAKYVITAVNVIASSMDNNSKHVVSLFKEHTVFLYSIDDSESHKFSSDTK